MLYRRALGQAFDALPPALQRFHDGTTRDWTGEADVETGSAPARLAVRLAGFPARGGHVDLRLRVACDGARETWIRHFGDHQTRSVQWLHAPGIIAERVGQVTLLMRPAVDGGALRLPVVGVRALGAPMPRSLLRASGGVERAAEGGSVLFDVSAVALGLGPLIRYRGALHAQPR